MWDSGLTAVIAVTSSCDKRLKRILQPEELERQCVRNFKFNLYTCNGDTE